MKISLLPLDKISDFVFQLSQDGPVFYPILEENRAHLVRYFKDKEFNPNFIKIRAAENIKHFLFPSRATVAVFPADMKIESQKQYLFGVKNCDLRGVDVYDRVFQKWEPLDPFYKERRENTIIISADCPIPEDSCFCNLVGLNPYASAISDMNFTTLENGLLFEAFTDKGMAVIEKFKGLFNEAGISDEKQRDKIRQEAVAKLDSINKKKFKDKIGRHVEEAEASFMRSARNECVECHACLHICPTCYCFLLSDYKRGKEVERIRSWDTCYYAAYARVGGGANPRSRMDERFWNRFQCKFNYFIQYENLPACSGCGRCFLGCSAEIDIREILWKL